MAFIFSLIRRNHTTPKHRNCVFQSIRRKKQKLFLLLSYVMFVANLFTLCNTESLYKEGDNILELDVNNFNSLVYNKPTSFIIEFYSSWCGHCINYAPHYVQFAGLLKSWNNVVIVAALNCADEANSVICREHEIDSFPTLKYFKVWSKTKADSIKYKDNKDDLSLFSLKIAEYAKADFDANQPITWPKYEVLSSSKPSSVSDLWTSTDASQTSLLCILVEDEPSYNGYALLTNYASEKRIHIVLIKPIHVLAAKFGGVQLPAIHIFHRSASEKVLYSSNSSMTWVNMKEKIDNILLKEPLLLKQQIAIPYSVEPKEENKIAVLEVANWKQFEVQLVDLQNAVLYMLTQEIPRKPVIQGLELSALRGFIHLLRRFAPGTVPIRRFFYRLDVWLNKQSVSDSITANKWLAAVEKFQNELGRPLPSNLNYLACRGSNPNLRGYTCGLWTLFHAITVQAYRDEYKNVHFKPYTEVLKPIYNFIFQFLSCEICATNFDKMSRDREMNKVKNPEDVVLWLWKAHNAVNKRLSGTKTDDPKFQKQQFPPLVLCSDCRQSNGEFDDAVTLKFLLKYYSDIKMNGITEKPGYQLKQFENGHLEKIANRHLNPKFAAGLAGKVDILEELESRLKAQKNKDIEPKRKWKTIDDNDITASISSTDNSTFYLICFIVVGFCLGFALIKYRQNRSKFWKTFYYYNDYKL